MIKELFDQAKAKVADGKRLAKTIDSRIKGAKALHKAIKEGGTESYKKVGELLKQMEESPKDEKHLKLYFKKLSQEAGNQELSLAQLGRLFQTYIRIYKV